MAKKKHSFSIHACLWLCLHVAFLSASGQNNSINSLKEAIQNSTNDNEKADLYSELAGMLFSADLEEGYGNAEMALTLSRKANYKRGIAQALTLIGTYHHYKGSNVDAVKYFKAALRSIDDGKTKDYPFTTLMRLSILYRMQAYFDSSRYYLDKAKVEMEGQPMGRMQGSWYASMGLLSTAMSRNEEALRYLKTSLAILQQHGDSLEVADTWRILGGIHSELSQYDSAEYCYDKAQIMIGNTDDRELRMTLFVSRGETKFSRGEFVKASENYSLALDALKGNTNKHYYSILLFKIGELYENQGAYHTAYDYLFNAMKEFESINARQEQAKALTQIGWCYAFQENFPLAIENANNSLSLATLLGDSASIGQNKNLIGYIYSKQKKYDDALLNFEQALQIRRKLKSWWGVSFTLYNMAVVNIALHDNEKAYGLLFQSLEIDERIGKLSGILFTCNELGLLFAKEKKFDRAAVFLARANQLARSIPIPTQLLNNYKHYIFLYESQKNNAKLVEFYKLYTVLNDSLSNEINNNRMAKADALFQLQKKASEIEIVNKENEIKEERIKIQQVELNFQRKIIIGVVLIVLFLTILLTVIYRLFVSNRKAKETLRKQNFEIIEKREEILAQSEELTESNTKLFSLNDELKEKNHEIEAQAEKIKDVNASLEKRVDERTSQLNAAYSELETFFYKTSHDFRRPLTTYLGLAEVAKASTDDKKILELFEKVKETTVGLDKMLFKLQSISNIDYENQSGEFSVSGLLERCVKEYAEIIEARQITVIITIGIDLIRTNEFLLETILVNLIENAIIFSAITDPYLKIDVVQAARGVDMIIADNGQGIPVAIQQRIFEMYFRGNDRSKGNGLGLYVAKRAADKLNATISFSSEVNKGSSFTLSVPNDGA